MKPAWTRAYEPPSLSDAESVGIVRFLMSIEEASPEIIAAIEGAVAWFRSVTMKGVRIETIPRDEGRADRRLVSDPKAPPLWARFCEALSDWFLVDPLIGCLVSNLKVTGRSQKALTSETLIDEGVNAVDEFLHPTRCSSGSLIPRQIFCVMQFFAQNMQCLIDNAMEVPIL